jgi:hypothetical protein
MRIMLKEAIEKIQELTQEAWKPQPILFDAKFRHGALLTKDGVEFYQNPDPLKRHSLRCLADLIEICMDGSVNTKSIWHNEVAIIGILSEDGRDQAVLPLTKTTDFAAIEALRGKFERMQQKRFVDFSSYTLGLDKVLVQPFRRLDWRGSNGAQGVAEFGASKMGKQIEATVMGIETLPETLILSTKMYRENVGQGEIEIRCTVDIEPLQQTIALVPDEKDLDVAIEAMQARIEKAILEELDGHPIGVYYGSP